MLESLEKRNLFVMPLDDERRWYRYHQLFADLLQARLHQSGSERAAMLRSRAAAWCEQDGQFAEAVGYALCSAELLPWQAELIAKYWHICGQHRRYRNRLVLAEGPAGRSGQEQRRSWHCVLLGAVAQGQG